MNDKMNNDKKTIALKCPMCGTEGNATRSTVDPKRAVLYEILCMECSVGCKVEVGQYYDKHGSCISDDN